MNADFFRRMKAEQTARDAANKRDDEGHTLREIAFRNWCRDTVFPHAVNRWIHDIGARA